MQLHNSADNFRIKIKKWGMIFLVAEVSEAIVNQVHKISEMSQKCSTVIIVVSENNGKQR
jgi:hypothetical protein